MMTKISLFLWLLLFMFLPIKSHATVCEAKSDVAEIFSHKSDYNNKNIKACIINLKDGGYGVYISNNNHHVSLNNLTKNLSAYIQDISISPSESGFSLIINVGENYTKTITIKFNVKELIALEEILIYIPRNSKMREEYKRIVYQYSNTNFEDLELEKILNDEF